LTKAFVHGASIIHMGKVPQQTVIVMTAAAVTIVMWISTLAMVMIPQAAYAQQDERNPSSLSSSSSSSSSSSDVDNCASDQLPASINGIIQCMDQENISHTSLRESLRERK
jgi:hypothetical protein